MQLSSPTSTAAASSWARRRACASSPTWARTIAMAFDECVENPSPKDVCRSTPAPERTRWLVRCKAELSQAERAGPDAVNPAQMLFGINQGGTYDDLRVEHMKQHCAA